jgi:hypothetical protein
MAVVKGCLMARKKGGPNAALMAITTGCPMAATMARARGCPMVAMMTVELMVLQSVYLMADLMVSLMAMMMAGQMASKTVNLKELVKGYLMAGTKGGPNTVLMEIETGCPMDWSVESRLVHQYVALVDPMSDSALPGFS